MMEELPNKYTTNTQDGIQRTKATTERDQTYKKIKLEAHKTNHQEKQPYCTRCARDEYAQQQQTLYNKRGASACNPNLPNSEKTIHNVPVKNFNTTDYKQPKHEFTKLGEHPYNETQNINGLRTTIQAGTYHAYQCTERGFKMDIQHPNQPTLTTQSLPPNDSTKPKRKWKKN